MAKERISKNYTTGKGILTGFISLFKPSTKFNKNGTYSASIILDKNEGEQIVKMAKEIAKEQFKTYGNKKAITELTFIKPLTTVNDEGEQLPDPDGRYIMKTSAKAWIEDGKPTYKIAVVDSKMKPVKNLNVGQGSTARLFVTIEGYTTPKETNVMAVLKAAQLINVVEFGGVNIDEAGFGIEDGFEYGEDEINVEETVKEAETEEDEPAEEDF